MITRPFASTIPQEKNAPCYSGFVVLLLNILGLIAAIACIVLGAILLAGEAFLGGGLLLAAGTIAFIALCILFAAYKVVGPNQALVLTLFGKYYGTLREPGFYAVNPFVTANAPAVMNGEPTETAQKTVVNGVPTTTITSKPKKISLKTRTLDNRKQKVNDALGNPIIIGSIVIWRVENPTAAIFAVENFEEYLSIQCDSTIRNIARLYPYDSMSETQDEMTLRDSSAEISEIMQKELAERVSAAGLVIEDVRITTLAYSEEIAAAMLQRQQATAIIAARQKIVEGAVGMVKMAIDQLGQEEVVVLDEERKAQMVSNLLVVLCGSKDAQPIVNSGSIY
ncbi:MAG: SPFH domain-containing protein [Clostridia bacterium]|nr:SPFH domain-containing protein [Clostridia bacterium]